MSHRNALLSPRGRLALARCVVEDGWSLRRAAERFQTSVCTVQRWAGRYRQLGAAGMEDRPSRPLSSPRRTPRRVERRIIKLRYLRRWGPARIGFHLGLHPSTVHKVLSRYKMARLDWLDRPTGRVVRRYEHPAPGDLVHVDVKKLGRIRDGGGHKVLGRAAGNKIKKRADRPGYAYIHNAVDDHSRLAYSEICADERKETAAAFWTRAEAFFASYGIQVQRVLTTQRRVLPLVGLPRRARRDRAQKDPALPPPDQRQGREVQPHPARRMGLRPGLPVRGRAHYRFPYLAASLQSPPRPHLTPRPATRQPRQRHQRLWSVQLGVASVGHVPGWIDHTSTGGWTPCHRYDASTMSASPSRTSTR